MNKTSKWLLMALLVVGVSMNLTSCKDDELTEEEKQQQAEQAMAEAQEWWDVVSQLTDAQELPKDWQKATFEPTIGKALESDPYTRIVSTNDLATAAQRFAYLTGAPVDEATADYTWSHKQAGSLTYHAGSSAGTYLAQVDVNLKQMPKLKKILYQTPEQMGENASGSFSGSAYYRFGDVIGRQLDDNSWEYWVCVRPAFSLEGKGDSHWISISDLPTKNIYSYTYGEDTWKLPTALGESKEHMQNFAEMLYAITAPLQYFGNLSDPKLKTFHDFGRQKFLKYHGLGYWKRVSFAWERERIFEKVFTDYYADRESILDQIQREGVNLIYKGYSWMWGWNCSLWQAVYEDLAKNLHTATYTSVKKDMRNVAFDVTEYNYHYNWKTYGKSFFGDEHHRYIVRYATGEELCKDGKIKGAYSPKNKISNFEDIYTYNKYFYPGDGFDLGYEPEETPDDSKVVKSIKDARPEDLGKIIGMDGKIYASRHDAEQAGTKAVAMFIDVRNENYSLIGDGRLGEATGETNNGITMKGGIAIALEDGELDETIPKELAYVYQYDLDWHNTHRVVGAEWRVPNTYLWQRLLLAFGEHNIWTSEYIRQNLRLLYDDYSETADLLYKMTRLMELLEEAGAGMEDNSAYLVAGGTNAGFSKNQNFSLLYNQDCKFVNVNPNRCRYVLVW